MGKRGLRVAVLSNVPEVVDFLTVTLERLGHELVSSVAANSKRPVAVPTVAGAMTAPLHAGWVVAPDKESLESILKHSAPDLLLCWGFPWRIPMGALKVPSFGAVNFHPSLLPRHRGPYPVAWTIRMGDENFGVTWHRIEAEFDTGPIMAQRSSPVSVEDTNRDVIPRLTSIGLRMLGSVIDRMADGEPGDPQPTEGATEEGSFGRDYAVIDWSLPARAVHDQVRAWGFIPPETSVVGPIGKLNGRSVRVLSASLTNPDVDALRIECGDGPLWVTETEPVD
jgi:methionyl-tRNA formyltransferase